MVVRAQGCLQIHGLEESEGTKALVMELVERPTLADCIASTLTLPWAWSSHYDEASSRVSLIGAVVSQHRSFQSVPDEQRV